MKHYDYKGFTLNQGFRSYAEIITHDGDLVWGVSKKDRAFILHDSCGRAYLGLKTEDGKLIDIDRFHPSYKGQILKYTHVTIEHMRFNSVIQEQGDKCAWGVYGMMKENHHLVTDWFGRVYTGLVTKDGEEVVPSLIVPSYCGKVLLPYTQYDIKA